MCPCNVRVAVGIGVLIFCAIFSQKMSNLGEIVDRKVSNSHSPNHLMENVDENNFKSVGERGSRSGESQASSILPVDFNNPNFWQAQVVKHLEGVRTLDCELIWERQRFGADQNEPESRLRDRFVLAWDREHRLD